MNHISQFQILIVDDEVNFLASIRRILRGNFNIITTTDPVQALKIVELQGPFAVVISDFQMPLMNGIQLFAKIVAMDKKIQKIMITGHADLQMAIDAINYGKIDKFLTKPISSTSLRSVVIEAIQTYKGICAQSETIQQIRMNQEFIPPFTPLTIKEKEVLTLLAQGFSNDEISISLNITIGTVKSHVNSIFTKLHVNNRTKAVTKAVEGGLLHTHRT